MILNGKTTINSKILSVAWFNPHHGDRVLMLGVVVTAESKHYSSICFELVTAVRRYNCYRNLPRWYISAAGYLVELPVCPREEVSGRTQNHFLVFEYLQTVYYCGHGFRQQRLERWVFLCLFVRVDFWKSEAWNWPTKIHAQWCESVLLYILTQGRKPKMCLNS